jgi:hypothetical protein
MTDPDQREKFMFRLSARPIHTFSLSNQECGVDKTNRVHLERKWPYFGALRPFGGEPSSTRQLLQA